jgi:molybdopterin-guanine dinucleotide biosynthesis protein B
VALVKPVIFQVVGYQNSGKTTFILKIIHALKDQGLQTATIKHHGHGGKPDVLPEKDSSRHLTAGALVSIVEGDGRLILQAEKSRFSLVDQLTLLEPLQPDIILIEGRKQEDYPKMLMLRDRGDLPLLTTISNAEIIICWTDELIGYLKEKQDIPCFSLFDPTALKYVIELLKGKLNLC